MTVIRFGLHGVLFPTHAGRTKTETNCSKIPGRIDVDLLKTETNCEKIPGRIDVDLFFVSFVIEHAD